ncbi:MAG: hypothetical protein ABSH08_16065 [Tepidisphaeraceae bacterium]
MEQRPLPTFTWIFAIAFLAVLAALGAGVILLRHTDAPAASVATGAAFLCAGYLGLIAILVTLPIALNLAAARRSHLRHQAEFMTTLSDRLEGISILMNLISEQQLLSDRAKAVAFREKDHDAVRRAVVEEIAQQNWEAAYLLANDIETQFGFKQEADEFRKEITAKHTDIQRRVLAEMLAPVDRHIKGEAWGAAMQEAQLIMERFPDDPQCQRLPEEIESRRQLRKQQLRQSWQDSIDRHDVDGSIEILKRLDLYLTPAEAESMQEIARNVFKEKREALRIRFSQSVKEQRIADAIRLGEEIMNDFPNTRMAQEVHDIMDTLRQRMHEPQSSSA